jgi:hypothetical protein
MLKTYNIQKRFSSQKILRNIPYLSTGVSQQGIPNWWFHFRNLLEEDILLAVTESSSRGTALKLPPISSEITGYCTFIVMLGNQYHSFPTVKPNFKIIISILQPKYNCSHKQLVFSIFIYKQLKSHILILEIHGLEFA